MKKTLFAALCSVMLLCACSDSPSGVVEKHFDKLQSMTVEEVKADIQERANALYDQKYTYYWEVDEDVETEEEAAELAAADKERYLNSFKDWDEDSYKREARKRSETYAFATMEIVSEEINGNTAVVKAVISYRGDMKEDVEFKLTKNSEGDWVILPDEEENPEKTEDAEDAEETEETEETEEE